MNDIELCMLDGCKWMIMNLNEFWPIMIIYDCYWILCIFCDCKWMIMNLTECSCILIVNDWYDEDDW